MLTNGNGFSKANPHAGLKTYTAVCFKSYRNTSHFVSICVATLAIVLVITPFSTLSNAVTQLEQSPHSIYYKYWKSRKMNVDYSVTNLYLNVYKEPKVRISIWSEPESVPPCPWDNPSFYVPYLEPPIYSMNPGLECESYVQKSMECKNFCVVV